MNDWTPPHGIERPGITLRHPWRLLATLTTFWLVVGVVVWAVTR